MKDTIKITYIILNILCISIHIPTLLQIKNIEVRYLWSTEKYLTPSVIFMLLGTFNVVFYNEMHQKL